MCDFASDVLKNKKSRIFGLKPCVRIVLPQPHCFASCLGGIRNSAVCGLPDRTQGSSSETGSEISGPKRSQFSAIGVAKEDIQAKF